MKTVIVFAIIATLACGCAKIDDPNPFAYTANTSALTQVIPQDNGVAFVALMDLGSLSICKLVFNEKASEVVDISCKTASSIGE